jgi:hypothetical protein
MRPVIIPTQAMAILVPFSIDKGLVSIKSSTQLTFFIFSRLTRAGAGVPDSAVLATDVSYNERYFLILINSNDKVNTVVESGG